MHTARLASVVLFAGALLVTGCGRSAKRENVQLKSQNSELVAQLNESEDSRNEFKSKYESTQQSLAQMESRAKDLSTQLDAAKRAAFAAQSRYNEAFRSLQALQSKSDMDSKALAEANVQVETTRAAMEKAVAEAAAANEHANSQIAELSRQIASLQAKAAEQAVAPSIPGGKRNGRTATAGEK